MKELVWIKPFWVIQYAWVVKNRPTIGDKWLLLSNWEAKDGPKVNLKTVCRKHISFTDVLILIFVKYIHRSGYIRGTISERQDERYGPYISIARRCLKWSE